MGFQHQKQISNNSQSKNDRSFFQKEKKNDFFSKQNNEIIRTQPKENVNINPYEPTKKELKAITKYAEKYEEMKIDRADEIEKYDNEREVQDYLRPIMRERYKNKNWWTVTILPTKKNKKKKTQSGSEPASKIPNPKKNSDKTNRRRVQYADELYFQHFDLKYGTDPEYETKHIVLSESFRPTEPGREYIDFWLGTKHVNGIVTISISKASKSAPELEIYLRDERNDFVRQVMAVNGQDFNIHKKGEAFSFPINEGEALVRVFSFTSEKNLAYKSNRAVDFTFYKIEFEKKVLRKKAIRFAKTHSFIKPDRSKILKNGKFRKKRKTK